MNHIGEVFFGYLYGKGFNLTCPYRLDSAVYSRQRKAADSIEEASKCDFLAHTITRITAWYFSAK